MSRAVDVNGRGVRVEGRGVGVGSAIPDSGVSRWDFEEGSGSTAEDSWGENGGSIAGASYTTNAKRGDYALDFDGSGDEVTIPDDSSISFDGDFTISLWVNFDGLSDNFPRIVTKSSGDGGNYDVYYHTNDNDFKFRVGGNDVASGVSKTDDTWTHIVAVSDSGTGRIYINNTIEGTGSISPSPDSGDAYIGSKGGDAFFSGYIDDVRIYDDALSESRIEDIFNGDE